MQEAMGFAHFVSQADAVAKATLGIMLLMSAATWYLIFTKFLRNLLARRRSRSFLAMFWDAPDLRAVGKHLGSKAADADEPFAGLVRHGLRAADQQRGQRGERLVESGGADDFLTRSLRRSIDASTAHAESGLTVLASIGSSAPFVGLCGTVWGIYHALLAIGMSGQGTLDRVAGPVGEALIMTAIGLAVAIPAVLAYNGFTRHNRVVLAELDAFAHDLFTFISTGHRAGEAATQAPRTTVVQPIAQAA